MRDDPGAARLGSPERRTIRLALVRHLASKPAERIGTLFIHPGGPGDTGVGLVRGDPKGIDAIGAGRFDVVSWDPRGAHASTRVHCFKNAGAEARFWAGASFPTSRADAKRSEQRGAAVAKRCGKISGWLLPHLSTADTARDLDHLRVLMGEQKLTFVGLSYGSYIGETYASLFPNRVRAMLLNGIVDPVRYSKSAESRVAMWAAAADKVFGQFLSLCETAGQERCARGKRKPIPAPGRMAPR